MCVLHNKSMKTFFIVSFRMADFLSFQVVGGLRFFFVQSRVFCNKYFFDFEFSFVSYWHSLYFLFPIFQTCSSRAQAMT